MVSRPPHKRAASFVIEELPQPKKPRTAPAGSRPSSSPAKAQPAASQKKPPKQPIARFAPHAATADKVPRPRPTTKDLVPETRRSASGAVSKESERDRQLEKAKSHCLFSKRDVEIGSGPRVVDGCTVKDVLIIITCAGQVVRSNEGKLVSFTMDATSKNPVLMDEGMKGMREGGTRIIRVPLEHARLNKKESKRCCDQKLVEMKVSVGKVVPKSGSETLEKTEK